VLLSVLEKEQKEASWAPLSLREKEEKEASWAPLSLREERRRGLLGSSQS